MSDQFLVDVDIHKPIDNGVRVKVKLPSLGLFLNGVRVFKPIDDKDWAVYPASTWVGNRWARMTEFDTKLPLWQAIRSACIKAAKQSMDDTGESSSIQSIVSPADKSDSDIMSDEELQVAFDALPFN